MVTTRATARFVGSFFILSNVLFIIGAVVFLEPVLSASDFIAQIAQNRTTVVLGSLLELLNAFAYLGIALFMFPMLKGRYEILALGYLAFRILEFVMQIAASVSPLPLLNLSAQLAGASPSDGLMVTGALLLAVRTWAFHMISVTLASGAFIFYSVLLKTKLVPGFISIWGLLGAAIVLVNTLAEMAGVSLPNLGYLMLANELFLGGWLIIKGFRPEAVVELAPAGT